MKIKVLTLLAALSALTMLPAKAGSPTNDAAPTDTLAPGIYTIVDGKPVPLRFINGKSVVATENDHGVECRFDSHRYNGLTSGITADSTFVLAVDPKQTKPIRKFKEYFPFIKSLNPGKMMIVPLKVNAEGLYREYYAGMTMDVLKFGKVSKIPFKWEKAGSRSFTLKVPGLVPGEYGIIFRPVASDGYDYNTIFDFTIK